jgi:hypothetical protein
MGTITFQLPSSVAGETTRELDCACLAGGSDSMPWPTSLRLHGQQLTAHCAVEESGYLVAPWTINGRGQVMGMSATLIERQRPYHLLVELARGKINQLRSQAHEYRVGGVQIDASLTQLIREASNTFGQAVLSDTSDDGTRHAQKALDLAYQAADELVRTYVQQVFHVRHQRQPRLDSTLACLVGPSIPDAAGATLLGSACTTLVVPLTWNTIEMEEGSYHWAEADALVAWAMAQGCDLAAGPLIDFSAAQLPAWLWLWDRDLPSLATFMCKFVEAVIRRYRTRIRRWRVTAGSNCAAVLSLSEDDLLGLTYRLAESARQVDPGLELMLSIAQPWGEYMALADRNHSPFVFADTLIRSGLNLAALDLEIIMGVRPRGSYCRDLLDIVRLLDLYALLGVPLHVTLGYPASRDSDPLADPELQVGGGHWGSDFTPAIQAQWAEAVAALCLCKPSVAGVQWAHFSDAVPHALPNCGLVDAQGQPRPVLHSLQQLRTQHLHTATSFAAASDHTLRSGDGGR